MYPHFTVCVCENVASEANKLKAVQEAFTNKGMKCDKRELSIVFQLVS